MKKTYRSKKSFQTILTGMIFNLVNRLFLDKKLTFLKETRVLAVIPIRIFMIFFFYKFDMVVPIMIPLLKENGLSAYGLEKIL